MLEVHSWTDTEFEMWFWKKDSRPWDVLVGNKNLLSSQKKKITNTGVTYVYVSLSIDLLWFSALSFPKTQNIFK